MHLTTKDLNKIRKTGYLTRTEKPKPEPKSNIFIN